MVNDSRNNAVLANQYRIEIDGIEVGAFETCDLPASEFETVDYREGTDAPEMTISAGNWKPVDITLRKALRPIDVAVLQSFNDWHETRDLDKRSGAITCINGNGGAVMGRWAFSDALLVQFKPPSFDAKGNDIARAEMVIRTPRLRMVE